MAAAANYKAAETPEAKAVAEAAFMKLNVEVYGEPDETTYRSLLFEKVARISSKDLSGKAAELKAELIDLLGYSPDRDIPERFKPSAETVAWVQRAAKSLYGGMLQHVPEQESFNPTELAAVFDTVLRSEFETSADGWRVDVEEATAINVRASEKRIIIPENRGSIEYKQVRKLVCHEVGVHALRAITGEQTDLPILMTGLAGYQEAEEGLGMVMEQAIDGEYVESGIDHYISAGAAYIDKKDFRGAFEMKWRLGVLSKIESGDVTDDQITAARDAAYKSMMRSMRGTDALPWFKDLAYYNGAASQWQHLEKICGDDLLFAFVLMGKANAANKNHERVLYETKTP